MKKINKEQVQYNMAFEAKKINPLDLQNVKLKKTIVKPKEKIEEVRDLRIPTQNQLIEQIKNLKKI